MDRYGIIYMIKNIKNGKIYIGQTVQERGFDARYGGDILKNTHNDHLRNSILKYGIENFEIIKEFDVAYSQEELDEKEKYWINEFKSYNSEFGYNKNFGGSNGKHTEEIKIKLSDMRKGDKNPMFGMKGELAPWTNRNHSEESKQKISITQKERYTKIKHPWIGRKHKKESLEKMVETKKINQKEKGANNPKAKKVIMLDKNSEEFLDIFSYIRDTQKTLNRDIVSDISKVCKGKAKSAYGYKWLYLDKYLEENPHMIDIVCQKYKEKYNKELLLQEVA